MTRVFSGKLCSYEEVSQRVKFILICNVSWTFSRAIFSTFSLSSSLPIFSAFFFFGCLPWALFSVFSVLSEIIALISKWLSLRLTFRLFLLKSCPHSCSETTQTLEDKCLGFTQTIAKKKLSALCIMNLLHSAPDSLNICSMSLLDFLKNT